MNLRRKWTIESIEEVKVSVPKVNNEDPETSEEEIVVSSDDDEDIADETEEKLVGEAFKLLNQFFDKNPELLKDLEPVKMEEVVVVGTRAVRKSSRTVVQKVKGRSREAAAARRVSGCGLCSACRAAECGACRFCLDRPGRGGMGTLRQKCLQRVCRLAKAGTSAKAAWLRRQAKAGK